MALRKPRFNPIALRKAKIVCNFGLSECNRVKKDNIYWVLSASESETAVLCLRDSAIPALHWICVMLSRERGCIQIGHLKDI